MWTATATAKCDIPLNDIIVKKDTEITITRGKKCVYAIWHNTGIFDLPEEYIKNIKWK